MTARAPDGHVAPTAAQRRSALAEDLAIAATPRFRASQRAQVRDSARHGIALVVGTALLDCLLLVPLHPEAVSLVVVSNLIVALVAAAAFVAVTMQRRGHPEALVFAVLTVVDGAALWEGLSKPEFGTVVAGYLLLLPVIAALVMLWATRVHVVWLVSHSVVAVCFVALAPSSTLSGGNRWDMITLLVVAITVSQFGHLVALRARVLGFTQIERIRALNRQSRRDEARLDRLNRILEQTSRTDELTGLKNRLSLRLDLGVIRSRMTRHQESYGLLMLDLDRFKAINDQLGHVAGDRVLEAVAGSFVQAARAGDDVYRYGGEEFVMLMRVAGPQDAFLAAERLRVAVEALHISNPGNPPYGRVTVSVGVAAMGQEDLVTDDDAWFARADTALYRAKASGRNACRTDDPAADPPDVGRSSGRGLLAYRQVPEGLAPVDR